MPENCAATRHGTRTAYMMDGCRCPEARAAETEYRREYRKRRYLNRGPLTVNAAGTHRRIRALVAIGWPMYEMDQRLGSSGRSARVWQLLANTETTVPTRESIRRLYDELSMTPGPSPLAASRARAKGWPPPLAWDDDEIDDPRARPRMNPRVDEFRHVDEIAVEEAIAGRRPRLTKLERREAVARMTAAGMTGKQIADVLGLSTKSIDRIRARAAEGVTQGRADTCKAGHWYGDEGVLGRDRRGDRYCRVCKPNVTSHADAA